MDQRCVVGVLNKADVQINFLIKHLLWYRSCEPDGELLSPRGRCIKLITLQLAMSSFQIGLTHSTVSSACQL